MIDRGRGATASAMVERAGRGILLKIVFHWLGLIMPAELAGESVNSLMVFLFVFVGCWEDSIKLSTYRQSTTDATSMSRMIVAPERKQDNLAQRGSRYNLLNCCHCTLVTPAAIVNARELRTTAPPDLLWTLQPPH